MLGREGKAGWLRPAGSILVSQSKVYWPHGHTTPWPPPQRGGELLASLPSLVKEGLGVVAPHRNDTDQRTGFTPSRKVRKGRKERQKYYDRSQYLIEKKERIVETN